MYEPRENLVNPSIHPHTYIPSHAYYIWENFVYLRTPPRVKILEALSAIADKRVEIVKKEGGKIEAIVTSSTGERRYTVCIDLKKGVAYSDDNGTKYRGYMGYPILSLLMIEGVLPINEDLANALRGLPWKHLNEQFKKYALVEMYVKNHLKNLGLDPRLVDTYIDKVMTALRNVNLKYSRECLDRSLPLTHP